MISRRDFLNKALGAAGASAILSTCTIENKHIAGRLLGPDMALGHRLRTMDFGSVVETSTLPVVIIGGGIAGLTAAWYLKKNGIASTLFELESAPGGNSTYGENKISSYPWGAHYLPLPNASYQPLIDFLTETKVITSFENGLPVYDEYYLCFEPKERLYIHDHWQEGILPHDGVPAKDLNDIHRFTSLMEVYKMKTGADGKEAFCIPAALCSTDPTYLSLDSISMKTFLQREGFTSSYLYWYVNYCCADDYGASIDVISAWAGIHYFASRKGKAANASSDTMLTWPEGNGWLVKQFKEKLKDNVVSNTLAYHIEPSGEKVSVKVFDAAQNKCKEIIADHVILATPQFVNERLLSSFNRNFDYKSFTYSPWMVANISVNSALEEKRGEGLCWDNVVYGSNSVGYVNAAHQHINRFDAECVLTYYLPLTGDDLASERQKVFQSGFDDWLKIILADLKLPHPKLVDAISNVDIWRWGHGMIRPTIDFIHGENRAKAVNSINNRIHFAHSDLSGISIFEEAFYSGVEAAKKIIARG
jgi:hypothetical protein